MSLPKFKHWVLVHRLALRKPDISWPFPERHGGFLLWLSPDRPALPFMKTEHLPRPALHLPLSGDHHGLLTLLHGSKLKTCNNTLHLMPGQSSRNNLCFYHSWCLELPSPCSFFCSTLPHLCWSSIFLICPMLASLTVDLRGERSVLSCPLCLTHVQRPRIR